MTQTPIVSKVMKNLQNRPGLTAKFKLRMLYRRFRIIYCNQRVILSHFNYNKSMTKILIKMEYNNKNNRMEKINSV